jgi:hypothetical protein
MDPSTAIKQRYRGSKCIKNGPASEELKQVTVPSHTPRYQCIKLTVHPKNPKEAGQASGYQQWTYFSHPERKVLRLFIPHVKR